MISWPGKKADSPPTGPYYASFNDRMFASALDSCLLILVFAPVLSYLSDVFMAKYQVEAMVQAALKPFELTLSPNPTAADWHAMISAVFAEFHRTGFWWDWLLNNLLQMAVMGAAVVAFWIYRAATPGKMLLRLVIVDAATGGVPSTRQFIVRYLAYFVSVIPLFLGFFWIGWDKKKQGWHDKIAGTLVMKMPRKSKESKESKESS